MYGLYLPIMLRSHPLPGATETPTPAPTLTPTLPSGARQLIVNPSFETDDAWQIPQTVYPAAYTTALVNSGLRSIRLGLVGDVNIYSYSSVQQAVEIPATISEANLSFHYLPVMVPGDLIYFCVLEGGDDSILQCTIWTELSPTWHEGLESLLAFAGSTVKVHFGVKNDGDGGMSAIYLDDVELWVR